MALFFQLFCPQDFFLFCLFFVMKINRGGFEKENSTGFNHDDSPWGILSSYQKEKWGEKVSQADAAVATSNKHNDHHLPSCLHCDYVFFVAQSGVFLIRSGLGVKGENRSLIVNFLP